MAELKTYVLFRYKKSNRAIDTVLEGLGKAMLKMWALTNTTSSKESLIIEKDTGQVVYLVSGKRGSPPEVKEKDLGTMKDYNLSIIEDH